MLTFFRFRIPLYLVVLCVALTAVIIYAFKKKEIESAAVTSPVVSPGTGVSTCDITMSRLGGYNFIKPLLFEETSCESGRMNNIKTDITAYLEQQKLNGTLSSASVYLKDLDTPDWTGYNPDEKHNPGSLLKVPEMITLLKMAEKHPGFLDKKVLMTEQIGTPKQQLKYLSKTIEKNKPYSILELIKYMIAYSDNNATLLLNTQMDETMFRKTFTDLYLAAPDLKAVDYPVSAKQYSLFLRALYNASYLNMENSELATYIMSTSDFKEGFYKALPEGIRMAHKYGMARYNTDHELSEAAILYSGNKAFALTVMTRGKDPDKLPAILEETCRKVCTRITSGNM